MYVGHLLSLRYSTKPSAQHTFPHDYRSGPAKTDWDPSKWVILALSKLGVAWGLRRATQGDIAAAQAHMISHGHSYNGAHEKVVEEKEWAGPTWTETELKAYVERNGACVVLIDGYAVDVTGYTKAHVGSLPPFSQTFADGLFSAWGCDAAA